MFLFLFLNVSIPTALAREIMQSPPSVYPSVCFHTLLSFEPTDLALIFCTCVGHYHGSHVIETKGHRLRLGLGSRYGWYDLDPRSRVVF